MKLRYAFLALVLCLFVPGFAQAEPRASFRDALRAASVPVPVEWSGVWDVSDSNYNCSPLTFKNLGFATDTVCVGQQVGDPGSLFPVTCDGTADASTVHMHCTGSGDITPGCTANIDIVIDGTLSDPFTYYMVTTVNVTFTGASCLGTPNSCLVVHAHGVRIGDAPPAYCATPTKPTTWGSLKSTYR